MAELRDIRAGIAGNLATLRDCQISPYRLDNPTPPTIQVTGLDEAEATTYGVTGFSVVVIVQAFVGAVTDRGAQERLDRWLWPTGDESVWQALESDRTLGGTVGNSAVISNDGTQVFNLPRDGEVLGSTWRIQIET